MKRENIHYNKDYRRLRNRINILAWCIIILALHVAYLTYQANKVRKVRKETQQEQVYVPTRLDSLYRAHIERCAFVSRDMLKFDQNGFPQFKSWRYLRDH